MPLNANKRIVAAVVESPAKWKRMRFKRNKVWLALDAKGRPLTRAGKVLIKYQLEQDYKYWVLAHKVIPLDSAPAAETVAPGSARRSRRTHSPALPPSSGQGSEEHDDDTVAIYTDGASSGNPGPAGIGIVLRHGGREKEISKFIGIATNNVAELEAIRHGLAALKTYELPVRVFTDSGYAHGLLVLGWKPKKNQELVESIKKSMRKFKDLRIIKVRGHAGNEGNERADQLATSAIKQMR